MDKVDGTSAHLATPQIEPDRPSFFALILDLHPQNWITANVDFWEVLPSLLVLLNAHLAMDSSNEIAVFGYNCHGSKLLYSSAELKYRHQNVNSKLNGIMIPQFQTVDSVIIDEVKNMTNNQTPKTTSIAGPLSMCLSYLNRKLQGNLRGHILITTCENMNVGAKYIPSMNSIFSAQKLKVPIDVASFNKNISFLQQAADFTGGSYLNLKTEGLVQTLLSVYLVDPCVRQFVNLATDPNVNFSAVCFISKKVVEIGYVCSVCLCIMEKVPLECPVCKTRYERIDNA